MTDTDAKYADLSRTQLVELLGQVSNFPELQTRLVNLGTDFKEADEARAIARNERWNAERNLESLRESVTSELKRLVREEELSLEAALDTADRLGVDPPNSIFEVTIQIEVTITGVKAADADSAEQACRDALDVQLAPYRGSVEHDSVDFSIDRVSAEAE